MLGEFASVQVNVDANGNNIIGDAANEPSIAVDPTNPDRIVIGWRQFDTVASDFRQAGWGYSGDGGRSWTFPGVIQRGSFRSDPVLEADADGIFYYNSFNGSRCDVFKSTDGGRTWDAGVYARGGDKPWMAIDRTGGIGHGNIYINWDYVGCCGDNWFTRSTNGAASFEQPVPIPLRPVFGVTAVGPEGEVYVAGMKYTTIPNPDFVVAKSSTIRNPSAPLSFDFAIGVNMGGTLSGGGPNPSGLLGQVWIAADHSTGPTRGNVYMLASINPPGSDPLDVHFVRSIDGGHTWSDPIRVNDDPVGNNAWQWFGTMDVAPNGRIDAVWNDTRNDPGGVDSQLFYSFSLNTGQTWSASIAVGPPFDPHLGWPYQNNKLGDYYDMVSDHFGTHVAYAATYNGEQDVYYLRINIDCNGNGIPDEAEIANGSSGDCNGNQTLDECEIASCLVNDPACADCDSNGIPDGCEADCNLNTIVDVCDILSGGSRDANANGIPDECEGACCDGITGVCADVAMELCTGYWHNWSANTLCAELDPPCAGACCDLHTGVCAEDVAPGACSEVQQRWTGGATCSEAVCEAVNGACCNDDPFGGCTDGVTRSQCDCADCEWIKLGQCAEIECIIRSIPTVSIWGLTILSLLMLVAAKIRFGRVGYSGTPL